MRVQDISEEDGCKTLRRAFKKEFCNALYSNLRTPLKINRNISTKPPTIFLEQCEKEKEMTVFKF